MATLTDRQQEVLDRLQQDPPMQAKDIAKDLKITRNAVYQQITALKRKGLLSPMFTPSGEVRASAGTSRAEEIIDHVTRGLEPAETGGTLAVVRELVDQNSRLIEANARLTELVVTLTSER